jgi:hypothetical protein
MKQNEDPMRTITIVVTFSKNYPPDWIWDAHKNRSYLNAIFVNEIAEGNQIGKCQCDGET